MSPRVLVATDRTILLLERGGRVRPAEGLGGARPTSLAVEPDGKRAWCGTRDGVWRSDDGGLSWTRSGLEQRHVTAVTASPGAGDVLWAGSEPSAVWRSGDGGATWVERPALATLPSSAAWSFPPRPDTHHVRWIACHPSLDGRLWVAIEAGALVRTDDGGASWRDRVPDGPYDTHELSVHPSAPEVLRVAAGDGYYESGDGGDTWTSAMCGMDVGYLRSVAVDPADPDVVIVSAASSPRSAYGAGSSDGRLFRREGDGAWVRVTAGWPDPPSTIAPLVEAGRAPHELRAADERGVHHSGDGGRTWEQVAAFEPMPRHLWALASVAGPGLG